MDNCELIINRYSACFEQMYMEGRLKPTWDWILSVMDATEAQLRFGASLTHSSDPSHPSHPLHPANPVAPSAAATSTLGGSAISVLGGSSQTRRPTISDNPAGSSGSNIRIGFTSNTDNQRNFDRDAVAHTSRREFLTYALSLMRSHSSEHRDSLPVLDVTALRHIAYVLDGIVFYMRAAKDNDLERNDINLWPDVDENENDDTEDELQMDGDEFVDSNIILQGTQGRKQPFFQRSESTLCLGCPPPDPFNTPLCESLPLADQPHLLQPNARREDLFGIPKQPITIPTSGEEQAGVNSPLELPPTQLGLSPHRNLSFGSGPSSAFAPTEGVNTVDTTNAGSTQPEEMLDADSLDATVSQPDQPRTPSVAQVIKSVSDANDQAGPSTFKDAHPPAAKEPVPSASTSSGTKRKLTDHPDCFGNIYMQLKKKNYYDQYDEDQRASFEKKDDVPQDLSFVKDEQQTLKMDIDNSSSDCESDESTPQSSSTHHHQQQPQSLLHASDDAQQSSSTAATSVRPQIIVTPRKMAAAIESVTAAVLAKNNKTSLAECSPAGGHASTSAGLDGPLNLFPNSFSAGVFDMHSSGSAALSVGEGSCSSVIAQGGSSSSSSCSPSKSVIVRAGPSVRVA